MIVSSKNQKLFSSSEACEQLFVALVSFQIIEWYFF